MLLSWTAEDLSAPEVGNASGSCAQLVLNALHFVYRYVDDLSSGPNPFFCRNCCTALISICCRIISDLWHLFTGICMAGQGLEPCCYLSNFHAHTRQACHACIHPPFLPLLYPMACSACRPSQGV
jgi:hypothetical protein